MSRPVLLIIAYHFPPDNAIGGARPYRFYKYMKRLGYECRVLTASRQAEGCEPDIEYVPDPFREGPREGWAWQAERVAWKFLVRGEFVFGWSGAVWRAGRTFLRSREGDAITILSSAPPIGTHLAAWRLSRDSGCPWIADFRDPIHGTVGDIAMLQSRVAPALEHAILRRASLILANTDSMRDNWAKRYPELQEKIHVLWNGFDPEDVIRPEPIPERSEKVLSHVGELYGGRDIRPILHAVGRLVDQNKVAASSIKIRQVGAAQATELPEASFLDRAQAAGWLELRPPVPGAEARAVALRSDGLLLIQPHTAVQVPGKLFEYLRMGRPILAFVVPGSPVERILESAGVPYECLYPGHSPEEIESRILLFLAKLDGRVSAPNAWFEEKFEASRQTRTLERLIRGLNGSSGGTT